MALKLSELIAAYGDDKVECQKLDDCVENFNLTKHGTKATFGTSVGFDLNGFTKLGLIVWLDRERVAEIVAQSKVEG